MFGKHLEEKTTCGTLFLSVDLEEVTHFAVSVRAQPACRNSVVIIVSIASSVYVLQGFACIHSNLRNFHRLLKVSHIHRIGHKENTLHFEVLRSEVNRTVSDGPSQRFLCLGDMCSDDRTVELCWQ